MPRKGKKFTTPRERVLIARLAAYERWAQCTDRAAATAPAQKAARDRFEKQVDPDGALDPKTRAERAEAARRAHFSRLALKSAQARRARREAEERGAA
jgi:hypothetical protein